MKFDFNPINLRNPKVESIATFLDLRKDPNTGANAINVMTNSEADAKKIEARLEKVPEVLRVMSLDSFVPAGPAGQAEADRAGRQGARSRAQSRFGRCRALRRGERRRRLKGSADSLRKTAGDGKGPGAVASRRLADALSKLAESDRGDARQGAGDLRRAAEDRARPAQELAAGAAGQPEDPAARIWWQAGRPRTA